MKNQELKLKVQTLKVMTDALKLNISRSNIETILELQEMHEPKRRRFCRYIKKIRNRKEYNTRLIT